MPTTVRPRALLVAAGALLLPLLALAVPGTAVAESPSPNPSPTPCRPLVDPGCLAPKPSATATPTATASPTPSATPSRTATATPRPRRTSSPAPRSTWTPVTGSTENPVTGSVDLGGVATEAPTTEPVTKDTSTSSRSGDRLTRLLLFVLAGAVLLGISGATGLYLTRHHE